MLASEAFRIPEKSNCQYGQVFFEQNEKAKSGIWAIMGTPGIVIMAHGALVKPRTSPQGTFTHFAFVRIEQENAWENAVKRAQQAVAKKTKKSRSTPRPKILQKISQINLSSVDPHAKERLAERLGVRFDDDRKLLSFFNYFWEKGRVPTASELRDFGTGAEENREYRFAVIKGRKCVIAREGGLFITIFTSRYE